MRMRCGCGRGRGIGIGIRIRAGELKSEVQRSRYPDIQMSDIVNSSRVLAVVVVVVVEAVSLRVLESSNLRLFFGIQLFGFMRSPIDHLSF